MESDSGILTKVCFILKIMIIRCIFRRLGVIPRLMSLPLQWNILDPFCMFVASIACCVTLDNVKVRKRAKIRNRYNQAPHLT